MNTQYSDLGRNMRRVLQLLNTGGHYSAADISIHLHVCDPRSIIRSLRKKGIGIADYWVPTEDGHRFKRYFIREGVIN
ncbi:MAG: hypothetical protein KBB03_05065 [Tidjanibacter sp.]|jgi:hypothetical protein|nr:hypothetical protein [Tidjanibacter sp.]MBS1323694.1 hypothetical protein [Rikenellaceae bacterium]